ncbi:geranylgeranyl pyrophosphate synthase [Brachybacterium phenoliresistens]|uniref:Geranylgeranyl pyrophosphate synthase n=1 Tax=Brachybacterium phenoliresistens TaxID=396014 RepID=Z9JTN7_9MICO|nr:polyprenyl synthetase family protein [Brachybacterium phenoliresistens]EWS81529.1 geranylgeranyl pyrophosphate synthase [Brachybacterium phenoliresistens]
MAEIDEMCRLDRARASVLAELHEVLEGETLRAQRHGPHVQDLWRRTAQHIGGGKLMRPMLLLEVLDAFRAEGSAGPAGSDASRGSDAARWSDAAHGSDPGSGAGDAVALRCAAALEILHYAFLLHDDVIDHDLVRRGDDNLVGALHRHGRAGGDDGASLHWARSAGILMGDLLLSRAHQLLARVDVPAPMRAELLDLLDHAVTESAAGEFLDVGLADGMIPPARREIDTMTRSKTAVYSVELPLGMACVLAGAGAEVRAALEDAGRCIGIAFQLQDDALSAFGAEHHHGKDPWSDFREGKQTRIMDAARSTASWPAVAELLGRSDLTDAQGLRLRGLLVDCGARDRVAEEIEALLDEARRILHDGPARIPAAVVEVIEQQMRRLEGRTR